ncbi:MAG TPA: peptidoglycan-binding domain-containing protein [Solirubrobacteraceae bacterium]|nr:peptidoglycan-binding domain-containing protein [Solirubrobacteraceae bacterium]
MSLRRHAAVILVPGTGYGLPSGSSQVRTLQHQLDREGFAPGPVDGLYGPLTTEAVRRFQHVHGLVVDGLAGPRTFTALRADHVRSTQPVRSPGPARSRDRRIPAPRRIVVPSSPPALLLVEAKRLPVPDLPTTPVLLALALLGLLTSARGYLVVRRRAGHAGHGGRTR